MTHDAPLKKQKEEEWLLYQSLAFVLLSAPRPLAEARLGRGKPFKRLSWRLVWFACEPQRAAGRRP